MTKKDAVVEKVRDPRFSSDKMLEAAEFSAQLPTQTAAVPAAKSDDFRSDIVRISLDTTYTSRPPQTAQFSGEALITMKAELPEDSTRKTPSTKQTVSKLRLDRMYLLGGFGVGLVICFFMLGFSYISSDKQDKTHKRNLSSNSARVSSQLNAKTYQEGERLQKEGSSQSLTRALKGRNVKIQRGGLQAARAESPSAQLIQQRPERTSQNPSLQQTRRAQGKKNARLRESRRPPSEWLPPAK